LLLSVRGEILRRALAVLVVVLVSWLLLAGGSSLPDGARKLVPVLTLEEMKGDDVDVARWAGRNVEADAVFVIPASLGSFRLHARRAVVVEWKALPFEELAMRDWRERIRFCYGEVASTGFAGQDEMDASYETITDGALGAIRDRYGARFAVLYRETPTRLPVLFANATYQVVALQ
jgi:hypothetical protein